MEPLDEALRILQIIAEVTTCLDPGEVLGRAVTALHDWLGLPVVSIALLDQETGELRYAADIGLPPEVRLLGFRKEGTARTVLATGIPVFVEDAGLDPRVDARSSGFRRAYACLPIDHQGARFGLLFVNFSEPHPFPDTERRLLSTFARQLGIALDNAHLHQQLRLALDQVKTLSGLIPICSYCSRIRSDEGYWQRVEAYIRERTEAQFTHGICPDCFERAKQEIAGSVGSGAHGLSHR